MNSDKAKKRAVSLLIALMFVVGLCPIQAFATEQTAQSSRAQIAFEVEEQIEGDIPEEEATFVFILEAEEAGDPLPASCTATIEGEGTTHFDKITFTSTGRYNYTIRQEEPALTEYTHDDTVYHMSVRVVKEGGQLIATASVYKDRETAKSDALIFINEYEDPNDDESSNPNDDESSNPNDDESSNPNDDESSNPNDDESSNPNDDDESSNPNGDEENSNPNGDEENSNPNGDDENSNPNGNEDSSQSGTPNTGDTANSIRWMLLMCIAVLGLMLGIQYRIVVRKQDMK